MFVCVCVCVCANETKVIRLRYGTVDCKCDKRCRDEGHRTPDERQRQQIVLEVLLAWDLRFRSRIGKKWFGLVKAQTCQQCLPQ